MGSDQNIKLLLVDDQPANLAVLEAILADVDAALIAVTSGEAALREVLAHEFAVVLLDVRMPGMSGFEVAQLIREHPRTRALPIIFLTAGDPDEWPIDRAYALGAVDYLTKPINPVILRAKVAVFIDLYRKGVELADALRERHQAQLRSRDARLRLILDNIHDYAFIGTDVARRITEWEGGAAHITGWSADEVMGQSIDLLFTPEDQAAGVPQREAAAALEHGSATDRRWHMRQGGERFFADGVTVALRDEAGQLAGFAKIARDATAEHEARARLAQSERQLDETRDRFSLLLASSGEGIFGLDRDGRCTFLNPAGAALLGYAASELEGRTLHTVLQVASEGAGQLGPIVKAAESGTPLRVDDGLFRRRDGSALPVAYSVYPMAVGDRTAGAVLTFTDITERRAAAAERERLLAELQAAGDQMRDIFHRAPAMMAVMRGADHTIAMANQRYLDLSGGRAVAGRPLRTAMPELEGQGFVELLDEVLAHGEAIEGTNLRLLLHAPGQGEGLEERFLDFACMPLRTPDDALGGVLLHAVDVTERTRANLLAVGQRSALELAVTDAPLGDVLDVLAHTAEEYAGGAAWASVQMLVDGAYLRHAAAPSLPVSFLQRIDALPIGPASGAAASAVFHGTPVDCADIGLEPCFEGHGALAREFGLAACRALPIVAPSGAVLGAFTLYYRERRRTTAPEEAALALLANTASLVIGQRHEAAERQAAEHRSRALLESMSEGFLALDHDWRITYANGAAEGLTRRGRAELEGGVFWDAFPGLAGARQESELRAAARVRERARVELYDEAQQRWFEINAFPMDAGGMALYCRDETDRRRAEEGVRRLAAVAEQSSDFIGIFTPDAGGLYLNPAGRRMAGLAPGADIGAWRLTDFFPPEDRPFVRSHVLAALTGAQATGAPAAGVPATGAPAAGAPAQWEGELRLAQPEDAPPLPVYFKGFAVRDADGNNIGLATITRDITAQKHAEDALRRVAADLSEADHRKSEFLATLAHELRNPLAPIRTGLDLLRMGPRDADALLRVHGMMDRQLNHLIHLVDDLLDIARITRGKIELKKEPVLLETIVGMAVETSAGLIASHKHTLSVELLPPPLELEVDVTRLVQVLSNLLNNAAKYTPAGGKVALSAWREDGHAVIAVTDTGIGIPAESIGAVFEIFTQVRGSLDRAQGGLGIGLSLVRRLVELHGGRVSAFSAGRGQGSTFTVRLPLRPGTEHALTAAADEGGAASVPPAALKVLVVDDNLDAAESLVALLEILGHTTRIAHDGPQGLAAAQSFLPDLVLLDIGLPGMSGYDVARAIRRAQDVGRPVLVALTGWGAPADQQESQDAGFDRHLTKPVSVEALEQTLRLAQELAVQATRAPR